MFRRRVSLTAIGFGLLQFLVIHNLDVPLGVLHVPHQSLQPPLDLLLVLQGAADHDGLELLVDGARRGLGHAGGVQGQEPLAAALHVIQQLLHQLVDYGGGLVQRVLLHGVSDGANRDLH